MGQKINPLGFRLGIVQKHRSNWFAKPANYSTLVEEDNKIRNCIKEYVKKYVRSSSNYGGVADVQIQRKTDLVQVQIHSAFPSLLVNTRMKNATNVQGRGLEQLRRNVQMSLNPVNRKLQMTLVEVQNPYGESIILAEYIALQLESRVAFRKTMKKAIELANKKGHVNGIKIQIAGRLNGAEIARIEWAREGRVPLQTLRAKIDYCHYPAQTIYGVLGIKVWIYQNH